MCFIDFFPPQVALALGAQPYYPDRLECIGCNYCCPDCPNCLTYLSTIDWAASAIWAAIKKCSHSAFKFEVQ